MKDLVDVAIEKIKEIVNNEKIHRQSVMGLYIGQVFNVEGVNYIARSFPTYYTVIGENQNPKSCEPNRIKTSIRKTPTMFWEHTRTGNIICPTNPVE